MNVLDWLIYGSSTEILDSVVASMRGPTSDLTPVHERQIRARARGGEAQRIEAAARQCKSQPESRVDDPQIRVET